MRVLVTGATGYLGRALCELMAAGGVQVAGLARSAANAAELEARGYEAWSGDLTDPASLQSLAAKADAVVHAGLDHSPQAGAIDRAAVEAMLAGLEGSDKPFLYTSGVWVYGDTQGRVAGEVSMLHPPQRVAWRPAVEELVLEARSRGVQGCVVRPGRVFGRNTGFLRTMFDDARLKGAVQVIGDGENHWSNIHVDDLAELYAHIIADPAAGELFIACCGVPQPVGKIARAVAKAAGIEGKLAFVPVEKARESMGDLADCLVLDQRVASTKASRFYGWTVRHASIFDEIFAGSYLDAKGRTVA